MTIGSGIKVRVSNKKLMVLGKELLLDVHDNVYLTQSSAGAGTGMGDAFIGVESDGLGSRRVFPIGKLEGMRFMCVFRFKLWWMTQRMGTSAADIPSETQFLLVEVASSSHSPPLYAVFLPILEPNFRAVLQGNSHNQLEICIESGCPDIQQFAGTHLVHVAAASDPFHVITNAVKNVESHLQTFCHRQRKKIPDMLNWFGWCTWDAFYTNVTSQGVKEGLQSFNKGGISPKFVIIDDGWQSVGMDPKSVPCEEDNCANFANRLTNIKENHKFQKDDKQGHRRIEDGFREIIAEIKEDHNVKYVYVWHAITGYWGGVKPGVGEMEHYGSKITYPKTSPGVDSNENVECPDNSLETMMKNGLGLVNPEKVFNFYDELHSYLASAGIDGVKVDVQNVLETLGAGHGGRVALARNYHRALEASIARNFPDNGIISCMSHNTDGLYSAKSTAVIRASDDFWPRDEASHTIHVASVAYNTVFLGEFMQPDWDMFQSLHPMAEYHGAARAVGGCAIYVSDKPGQHDFELLKKLVLPDGCILRAKLPGRPTIDCLFSDPARDGKSLLKIWNMNDYSGVIGVFNCQGAGWCKVEKRNLVHNHQPDTISGVVRAHDVNYLNTIADAGWNGDAVIYSHLGGEVVYVPENECLPVTLKAKEYQVFTVVPAKQLSNGTVFAPIGLTNMFNSGGAVKALQYHHSQVCLKVAGCGVFGAYSSVPPNMIYVDDQLIHFQYQNASRLLTFTLRIPEQELYLWTITIEL
ncbi:putative galactinol--sucrose galactosyltransferase 1 [Bienertia sinuspersici]